MALAPLRVQESPQTASLSVTHAPLGKGGKNWITRSKPGNTGQLPAYIQNVRNGIMKSGKSESEATGIAIGTVRRWASGGGNVSPEVRAAAAKAIAEFEAMRGKAKVSEAAPAGVGVLLEGFSTGELRNFRGEWEKGGAKKLEAAFTDAEHTSGDPSQPHDDLEKVYGQAEKNLNPFADTLTKVGWRLNATVHDASRGSSPASSHGRPYAPGSSHILIAPLKTKERASEKVTGKYRGDASRLRDVVRGTVVVPKAQDLPHAVEAVRKELPKGWSIVAPESRYTAVPGSSVHTGATEDGYRDVSVLLRTPDGHLAELQINTVAMTNYKNGGGHKLYEKVRVIREKANKEGRDLAPAEFHQASALSAKMRQGYADAHAESIR